jgi:hypothetical protein
MRNYLLFAALSVAISQASIASDGKLTGTPIGTERCWNYEQNQMVLNAAYKLFDGDLNTYFATEARSYTWAGLDLGTPHVITRVGWSPRNDVQGEKRVLLGVFQGANSPDFLDAVPIYVIQEKGTIGVMSYGDVDCSRGFRYVRYVSTSDARCNMAELEFYGHEGDGDDSHMYQVTNLPTVVINTVDSEEPYDKEHEIVANIIIINDNQIDADKAGGIRERGNGSREFPKKPWRIKFEKKQQVLDAPAKAKKWTLINNYGDKTLMRNVIGFEIARRMDMAYVPYCRPVDVILNGEFKGCYQLCDQVEVNPNRVNITEMEPTDISGDALTGGYFIEIDAYAYQETSWFQSTRGIPVTIKSPDDDAITSEQSAYIKSYFQKLETKLYSGTFTNVISGYRTLLDIDSFLQHFIVNELVGNTDTYWSTFMYKDRGSDKFFTGPVWDMDLGFENDNRTYPITGSDTFLYNRSGASAASGMKNFVNRVIISDKETANDLSRLWSIARNERDLNAESLNALVDSMAEVLDQSQKLNFQRWQILNQYVHQNPRIAGSYEGEVQYVKDYITQRFDQLDKPALLNYDPTMTSVTIAENDPQLRVHVINGCIVLDDDTTFEVWNASGVLVYSGTASTQMLTPGIYIVCANSLVRKVVVR